jgi:hypothetical protein
MSNVHQPGSNCKPAVLPVLPDGLPDELKAGRAWFVWRLELRKGKWTKPPYQPNGEPGKSNDPGTWSTFDVVLMAYETGEWDGIGRMVTDGYVGVDLDDACQPVTPLQLEDLAHPERILAAVKAAERRSLKPWGLELVGLLDTYAEVSPSRTGVKLWARATGTGDRRKRAYADGAVEVYDCKSPRYFTVTGQRLAGSPLTINARQAEVDRLCAMAFPPEVRKKAGKKASDKAEASGPLTDEQVLAKARTCPKTGKSFQALWNGSTRGHGGDHSAADLALCNYLRYWCGRDMVQVDRLFRQSKLMRDKWDEKRGETTYGRWTLDRARPGDAYVPGPPADGASPGATDRHETDGAAEGPAKPPGKGGKKANGPGTLTVGPLTLVPSRPSATAARLSVRVAVHVKGRLVDWLVLTASVRARTEARGRLCDVAARHSQPGCGVDRSALDDAIGTLLAWAARQAEDKAQAPAVAAVLRRVVVPPLELSFRTDKGLLWSEAWGREVNRYEFSTMADDATLVALEWCRDAPPDRSALATRVRQEMLVLFATLEREAPTEAGAGLGKDSRRAAQFRDALRGLWLAPAIGEVEEGRHGQERSVQTSLAAKARRLAGDLEKATPGPWRPVHRSLLAYWKIEDMTDGKIALRLAMRAELASQLRRDLPGAVDTGWLLGCGPRYGAFDADATARLTDGSALAVLRQEVADWLLAVPDDGTPATPSTEGESDE